MASGKWFPKHISDLDYCSQNVIMCGPDPDGLHADHPRSILNSRKTIYRRLKELHKRYACKEFLHNFDLLEKYCGYSENKIPQLEDISRFLKATTGFTLRPVGGYQAPRDFLAGLAFRVFNCTQYIRHHKYPFYTPEPLYQPESFHFQLLDFSDMVHELLGHMAMFADPHFAQFSEEIGLASLGASDEECTAIARLYFFTIEFGLSLEDEDSDATKGKMKVYGAGLLSCVDELEFAVSGKAKVQHFEPDVVVRTEPLVTTYQDGYFYTRNFEEAIVKLRMYTSTMKRPFTALYNSHTQSIDVLNSKEALKLAAESLRFNVEQINAAVRQNIF
ncbi:unnamed protein product [Toxocara canis]|uniref:BH4_AAA_HYDROXYL_2 domain-containing protein n=1 Tax=Toxocara canis TaxID=6265 RepID=A0A183VAH6_TOXCA|nr:unnamed protein product [Toxocara canis]